MKIPNIVPALSAHETRTLLECVQSGWISTAGPMVAAFEAAFARLHGTEDAVATVSGTAAIHLGLLALGVGPGDVVLCPALTFVASVNPVRYCGAAPILIGIERRTLGMDAGVLDHVLEHQTAWRHGRLEWRATGQRVSAVLVAHLYGRVADVESIAEICARFGIPLLEDAAESLGARRNGRLAGTTGAIGCFSFNANKIVTCAGGGMIVATPSERVQRCRHLSTQARSDGFTGRHDDIGYNYRMNSLCAALGLAQISRLPEFLEAKRAIDANYRLLLRATPFQLLQSEPDEEPSHWMALARLDSFVEGFLTRVKHIADNGIEVRPIWRPVAHHAPYAAAPYFGEGHEDACFASMVCLPSSVTLTEPQQCEIVAALTERFAGGSEAP